MTFFVEFVGLILSALGLAIYLRGSPQRVLAVTVFVIGYIGLAVLVAEMSAHR